MKIIPYEPSAADTAYAEQVVAFREAVEEYVVDRLARCIAARKGHKKHGRHLGTARELCEWHAKNGVTIAKLGPLIAGLLEANVDAVLEDIQCFFARTTHEQSLDEALNVVVASSADLL